VTRKKWFFLSCVVLCGALAWNVWETVPVLAAESNETATSREDISVGEALRVAGLALAAAITMAVAGFATAKAQSAVGSGGTGALAEKPELFTNILVLFALPETIVVLGFVIAFLLIRQI